MPLIVLPIEIVHREPPRSGHLSTPDSGQPACPQSVNLQDRDNLSTTDKSPVPNVSTVRSEVSLYPYKFMA